jgi:hypothetical protein
VSSTHTTRSFALCRYALGARELFNVASKEEYVEVVIVPVNARKYSQYP